MNKKVMRLRRGRPTKRVRALADRLNKETVLEKMPKLFYVEDFGANRYRVGRTDWPGDVFQLVPRVKFDAFRKIYERLDMPLIDLTYDDDGSEWEKVRSA